MLAHIPDTPFMKALYDERKMELHILAHRMGIPTPNRHDCKLCPAPMDRSLNPAAILSEVYPQQGIVRK